MATPESYHSFDNKNGHAAGTVTPEPMASQEVSDPNNGQPWGRPAAGFNPWGTDSYKDNSFNAPYGDGQTNPDPDPVPTTNGLVIISLESAMTELQITDVVIVKEKKPSKGH